MFAWLKFGPSVYCAAILALAAATSSQAANPAPGDIGPYSLGMSFAAARAAAPHAKWSETLSRYTQKAVELEGRNALRLGGLAFDVGVKPLAYNGYQLEIAHAEEGGQVSEDRCVAAFTIVTKALEARFGPLGPMTPLSDTEEGGLPLGFQTVFASEITSATAAGQSSSAQVFRPQGTGTTMWLSGQRREGLTVLVGGRYLDSTSQLWPSTCVVTARLTSLPPRPAFEWVDLSRLPSPPTASVPSKRRSFEGMRNLPATAAHVEITCSVDRRSGYVSGCKAAPDIAEAWARPAERQGNGLKLAPSDLDPDSDIPLRLRIALTVDPADAKGFVLPAGVTPLKATEVAWLQQPTGESLERYYPDRAMRMAIGARITILCQIKADGGLGCVDETVSTAEGYADSFDGWGERVVNLYRAGPTLVDGHPSAGRWVLLAFALQPG